MVAAPMIVMVSGVRLPVKFWSPLTQSVSSGYVPVSMYARCVKTNKCVYMCLQKIHRQQAYHFTEAHTQTNTGRTRQQNHTSNKHR